MVCPNPGETFRPGPLTARSRTRDRSRCSSRSPVPWGATWKIRLPGRHPRPTIPGWLARGRLDPPEVPASQPLPTPTEPAPRRIGWLRSALVGGLAGAVVAAGVAGAVVAADDDPRVVEVPVVSRPSSQLEGDTLDIRRCSSR